MKRFSSIALILSAMMLTGMKPLLTEVKLECVKRQHATRTCHYNFLVNGIPHHYIDHGCRGNRDKIIKKAETGKLGLHKDWKIACAPAEKPNPQ